MDDIILKSNNLRCAFYAPLKLVYLRRSGLLSLIRRIFLRDNNLLKFYFSQIKKFELQLKQKPSSSVEFISRLYLLTRNNRVLIWQGLFADRREINEMETQLSKLTDSQVEIIEKEVERKNEKM
jgi:hypothetical protein